MAVNFIRIRSQMIFPLSSLWNVYTQILRHNSENKDKLEKFLNNITSSEIKKVKVHEVEASHISNYHDELVSNYDEEKMLQKMINQNQKMTRVKWINFRNECLQHVSNGECSMRFYEKFIEVLYVSDPKYYEENEVFLEFLKNFILWRLKEIDIDIIINSLSNLYEHPTRTESDESKIYQHKVITKIIEDMLTKHGNSAVVKIRKSFEAISEKSHYYELLYVLWTKLFESFWYSDQNTAEEIIERHEEVRNVLASRSKRQCFRYFQAANTELVNKIIQIFLRHNMRTNAIEIIKMYLAYECWQKNSRAATEIVNLCIELNIPLTESENKKFLNLLLGRSSTPFQMSKQQPQQDEKKKIVDIKKYKFQF